MSMTPDERMDADQALIILRVKLQREREKRREWQAWALALEQQMQREGWISKNFDDLPINKPQ